MNIMKQADENIKFIKSKLIAMERGKKFLGKLVFQYDKEEMQEIPIYFIKGIQAGKTIWIQGGLHGDEYDGIVASILLAEKIDVQALKGNVLIIPKLNVTAFNAVQNGSAVDGINLNRVFKENNKQSFSYGYGEFIYRIISKIADYVIDLHGGGQYLDVLPFATIAYSSSEAYQVSKKMAEACEISYIFKNTNRNSGMLIQKLSENNIPALIIENGGGLSCSEETVNRHLKSVFNILEELGFLHMELLNNNLSKTIIQEVSELYFQNSGILLRRAKVGDIVKKNDLLLEIMDIENNQVIKLLSSVTKGVVLSIHTAAKADSGKYAVMLGLLK